MKHSELYETLGFNPDNEEAISQDMIKAAYRRMAAMYHPDKEDGSVEQMAAINHAYAILRDPKSRAKYDATGEGEAIRKDDPLVGVDLLQELLQQALQPSRESIFGGPSKGYKTYEDADLMETLLEMAEQGKANLKEQRQEHVDSAKALKGVLKRLKHKAKKNAPDTVGHKQAKSFDPLGGMLRARIAQHEGTVAKCDQKMEEVKACIDMLDHYEFTFDSVPQPTAPKSTATKGKTPYLKAMLQREFGENYTKYSWEK